MDGRENRDTPANTKYLYNIRSTSADVVQMLHKCFVFTANILLGKTDRPIIVESVNVDGVFCRSHVMDYMLGADLVWHAGVGGYENICSGMHNIATLSDRYARHWRKNPMSRGDVCVYAGMDVCFFQ